MTYTAEQLREMVAEATDGPWELDGIAIAGGDHRKGDVCLMGEPAQHSSDTARMCDNYYANATLVAAAPTIATALADALDEIARQDERAARICEALMRRGVSPEKWPDYFRVRSAGDELLGAKL